MSGGLHHRRIQSSLGHRVNQANESNTIVHFDFAWVNLVNASIFYVDTKVKMPTNTKVGRCVTKLTKNGSAKGKAIAICQKSTGQSYAVGPKGGLYVKSKNSGKYRNVPLSSFCGPAGGSGPRSFPVNTEKRCRAALSYARFAPKPCGIVKCALAKAKAHPKWKCGAQTKKECR